MREEIPKDKYELVYCPICKTNKVKLKWKFIDCTYQQCLKCKHIYQNPRPYSYMLLERYDDWYKDYEVENEDNFLNLILLGLKDVGFDNLISHLQSPKRFLDVGCATGKLLKHVKSLNFEVQGVDVCKPSADYGKKYHKVPIHIGTLESANFLPNYFDVIHCSQLLEHVPEPDVFLCEVFNLLKPQGYFICATPNTSSFQASLFKNKWRSGLADHVHLFSISNLQKLLSQIGFNILITKTWGGLPLHTVHPKLKKIVDSTVKILNLGDMQIILAQKP